MRAGIRPSEFWNLTPAEYNLIIDGYKETQKETMYRDIRNAYYTGCFAQVEKPSEFYDKIVNSLSAEPQTAEDMFSFLKSVAKGDHQIDALESKFNIPLKLTPKFEVGVSFSYIHWMEEETFELYLPDVSLSQDGVVLKPNKGVYDIKPGLVKIKYNGQVYTIVIIRAGT
ncbi:hypothetical protein SBF1_6510002 [Candidatus Desulfosporosinus infrequens]|uniref:Uncharacterized protein n=1 Tax=Candidatus Desulfosporosinus infrequens TaxID=2043169 RepID=A0A2U3LMW8_9FIRM|nr:hypothetical protein SBF1_6510002 [Candidatus Desulfosporosinus infrequens]